MTAKVIVLATALERPLYDQALVELRAHAAASHVQYPQYDGKYDGWVLGAMQAEWLGSGGTRLHVGEIVLMNPIPSEAEWADAKHVTHTVYDSATGRNCCVEAKDIRPVPRRG